MTNVETPIMPASHESHARADGKQPPPARLAIPQTHWRRRPIAEEADGTVRHATLSRWCFAVSDGPQDAVKTFADRGEPCHVVTVILIPAHGSFRWKETWLVDGKVPRHTSLVTGPRADSCRAEFKHAADLFRIFLPPGLIAECMEALVSSRPATRLCEAESVNDDMLTRLACSLVNIDEQAAALTPAVVEGVSIPMTARLISLIADPCGRREAAPRGLARWRLMRVLDYIDANFQRPVSLDELSQVAGLSRIRFGAQFRQTMGATPYAFILQRRIAYSQLLLRESVIPLAEIALMAGFSSQAHFTTIFSRMTGMPPGQWRRVASS